ncbi:MAG TPA: glycoside hydrolase family 16 protein [Gemmatimonadaceae bacterium]|nr:glycoside hydrolase family 16 protein [Gemmatimonadaceae bacterium]
MKQALLALLTLVVCADSAPSPVLVWRDEFDGPAGATFDRTRWTADTGGDGFGNAERQFYTTRPENVALDGNGHLVITAVAEPASSTYQCWYGKCLYSSARLKTQGLFTRTYGRIEARIKLPRGQGIWPAFWMLGSDIGVVGWPQSGEIDIMENIGREPAIVHGTLHGPGYSGASGPTRADTLKAGAYADDFHVFAVDWSPNVIRWYVDGRPYSHMTPAHLPAGKRWVFDHPFFLLLNVAVGGEWPGDPDAMSTYPQQMIVDYVRVYAFKDGDGG